MIIDVMSRGTKAERQLLLLFFLGIALLAGLAFFGSLDAALMSAFFAFGFGFFAAGFSLSKAQAGHERRHAEHSSECFNRLHVFPICLDPDGRDRVVILHAGFEKRLSSPSQNAITRGFYLGRPK
jgi:hypothetical protein